MPITKINDFATSAELETQIEEISVRIDEVELSTAPAPGGNLWLRGGASAAGEDLNGGDAIIAGGTSTGTGNSSVILRAATAGESGTTDRVAEPYITADGLSGKVIIEKPLTMSGNRIENVGDATSSRDAVSVRKSLQQIGQSFGNHVVSKWESGITTPDGNWTTIIWAEELGIFVATAQTGDYRIMTSTNGLDWDFRAPPDVAPWRGLAWSPTAGVIVGVAPSGDTQLMTSEDGITWEEQLVFNAGWYSVDWSPEVGKFLATSVAGLTMSSTDGIGWELGDVLGASTVKIKAAKGAFYTLTYTGTPAGIIRRSTDGLTFSEVYSGPHLPVCIAYSPELDVFVSLSTFGTNNRGLRSEGGSSWNIINDSVINAGTWRDIIWVSELGLFVALSSVGVNIATSTDGLTWRRRTPPDVQLWQSLAWAPSLSMICAVSFDGDFRVMTSRK